MLSGNLFIVRMYLSFEFVEEELSADLTEL